MKTSPIRQCPILLALALTFSLLALPSFAGTARHISGKQPVQGNSREMSADRATPTGKQTAFGVVDRPPNPWKLLATLPGAVIHDIAFATPKIGYAVGEGGQVWKTTNGGVNWALILNANYPYYWYGVKAFSATDLVISGIYDSSTWADLVCRLQFERQFQHGRLHPAGETALIL